MSLLSHDKYQYDSLILSKQTWAYPRQHLQQLLWRVVSVRLNLPEVEERKLCPWYTSTRRNHKQLSLDLLHNVESVYFFYSNPVFQKEWKLLQYRYVCHMKATVATLVNTNPYNCYGEWSAVKTEITFRDDANEKRNVEWSIIGGDLEQQKYRSSACYYHHNFIITKINVLEDIQMCVISRRPQLLRL